jgi:hypothetical protein
MGELVTVKMLRRELGGAVAYTDAELEVFIAASEDHWFPRLRTDAVTDPVPGDVMRGLVLAAALAVKASETPSPYGASDLDAGAAVPVTPVNTDPRLRWCFLDYMRPGALIG